MTCGNEIIDKCNSCNGTGLSIHTSSQDVIMLPMPKSTDTNVVALSDLVHIEHVQDGFLLFLKNEIKELIDDIMRTVFNSSNLIQADIAKTATEMVIDLQGIYATLNIIGKKVSDAFIWMVDVYCDANNIEGVTTFHGYTFNLKLETIDTLSEKRRKLTESGAPIEVIKSIDMAILQKQNIDNPQAINKYVIWESHKPFNEKSNDQINMILSSLPADNYYKVLYNFFGVIKSKIIDKYSSEFYLFNHEKQKQLIDEEVKTISESIKSELDFTPNFNELQ